MFFLFFYFYFQFLLSVASLDGDAEDTQNCRDGYFDNEKNKYQILLESHIVSLASPRDTNSPNL